MTKQGGMMILCLLVIFFMLFVNVQHTNAGELDAWEFNIMGITSKDFKDRDWKMMAVGVVTSLAVHEAGHVITARLMGTDGHFDWSERVAYAGDGYDDLSNDQKALYHGAGFLFQTVSGAILTAIPKTRHSDFTLGFNSFSSATGFFYGITGGTGKSRNETSDVYNLDEYGYCGTGIAYGSGIINGAFAYISLDKSDD